MQTPRSLFYLGVLNRQVYAVAGWKAPNSVSRSVERYNPRQNKWQYVTSLDIGLHEHAGDWALWMGRSKHWHFSSFSYPLEYIYIKAVHVHTDMVLIYRTYMMVFVFPPRDPRDPRDPNYWPKMTPLSTYLSSTTLKTLSKVTRKTLTGPRDVI